MKHNLTLTGRKQIGQLESGWGDFTIIRPGRRVIMWSWWYTMSELSPKVSLVNSNGVYSIFNATGKY